jgi:acetyltransferase-like isoleucine patch superfamily enzyme
MKKLDNIKVRSVKISENCEIGEGTTIIEPVNLYGCLIGENSFIGPFVEIQKNVVIGNNVKVQSHTFICELVTIGHNCFIGHSVVFINDLFSNGKPAGGKQEFWKKTIISSNVSIGSNSTILPVQICEGCVIGAGSVVTKDLTERGIYAGNPAVLIRTI